MRRQLGLFLLLAAVVTRAVSQEKSADPEVREIRRPKSDWTAEGFHSVRVGDFVLYQVGDDPLCMTRVEVLTVGEYTATLKVRSRFGSVNIPERQIRYIFAESDDRAGPQAEPKSETQPLPKAEVKMELKTRPTPVPTDQPETPARPEASAKLETRTSKVKIRVGNRELDAELRETLREGKVISQVWYSPEVPFDGIIKRVGPSGIVLKMLVDFGRGN